MPSGWFLCLFCARFALLKTGHSNRNLNKKGLKIESFLQKKANFFCFFSETPLKVTNFNTSPMPPSPPFENFLLNTLNNEQKPSVKIPVDRAGQPAMILKLTSRVEKILTGSISETK